MKCGSKKYAEGGKVRRPAPSYEEDMTPPRGMRGFRPNTRPADEAPSYEEDMTPPRGMRGFTPPQAPRPEPQQPRRMKAGGKVRGDGCAMRGKTKGRFV